jgi:methylated-DNA-[protein]-cysteine S-methyltransferase
MNDSMCRGWFSSPVGPILAVVASDGLTELRFASGRHALEPAAIGAPSVPGAERELWTLVERQLGEYFLGQRQSFDLPLAPRGTAFQRAVWAALSEIPFGETRSYAEIAARVGRPTATRAVGAANGQNPVAIIVPCHRVIGKNGTLTGYAGGIEVKEKLLRFERGVLAA